MKERIVNADGVPRETYEDQAATRSNASEALAYSGCIPGGVKHDIGTATFGSREGHIPHLLNKLATGFDFFHDVNFGPRRGGKLRYSDTDWTSTHDDGFVASR